jgi:hypothetical protein
MAMRRLLPPSMRRFLPLRCSFCGKSEHAVERLIAGPQVFICEACVDACIGILGEKPDWRDRQISRLRELQPGA